MVVGVIVAKVTEGCGPPGTLAAIAAKLDELEELCEQLPEWSPMRLILGAFLRRIPATYR
jgi:hypothetical protein